MTVFFLNRYFHPDHSATSQLASDLAFFLASNGMAVAALSSRLRYDDATAHLPGREEVGGVFIRRLWTTRFGRARLWGRALDYLSFYSSAALAMLVHVKKGDVIVAMTDPPMISVVAAPLAWIKGAKLVNWLQDVFPEVAAASGLRAAQGLSGKLLAFLRDRSLLSATANIVIGEGMAQRLKARPALLRLHTTLIHNWSIGEVVYPVPPEENPLRREWGLAEHFVVGYSGNMGRVHEFAAILDAAERLKSEPGIMFLFIGDGGQRPMLEEAVQKRGLANVWFKPYQPAAQLALSLSVPDVHLISLKAAMEGLVVPSKFYGVAAAGRAMLFVGDIDGEVARMIASAQCGYSVASDAADALVDHVKTLRDQPARVRALGERARNIFEALYSRERALKEWQTLLNKLTVA